MCVDQWWSLRVKRVSPANTLKNEINSVTIVVQRCSIN
jgi:hypothetical protein